MNTASCSRGGRLWSALVLVAVVALVSCGEDDTGGDSIDDADAALQTAQADDGAGATTLFETAGTGAAGDPDPPPGDAVVPEVPGCPAVNVEERLEAEEYVALRGELACFLDQPEAVPADVFAAAVAADGLAQARLAELDPGVTVGDEVLADLESVEDNVPPAFEDILDEAEVELQDQLREQDGG
jgi:hypothetical protein